MKATAAACNIILYTNCLKFYVESMEKCAEEKSLNADEPFFIPSELHDIHKNVKMESLSQV